MSGPALRDVQRAFWHALASGDPPADLTAVVAPSASLAPADRVGIYAGMYVARIVEALAEDFPKVAATLGTDAFADVVRAYVACHPSSAPSIRHLGAAFPGFVAGREPGWLGDLARLEWTRLDVFDAPDATALTVGELQRMPADAWPGLRFALVPGCARLVTDWPVQRLWSDEPPVLAPERTALRVWREGFLVYQSPMDAAEEAALERLAGGEPFATVCEAVDDPRDAAGLLLRWLEDGILARAWMDPDAGCAT